MLQLISNTYLFLLDYIYEISLLYFYAIALFLPLWSISFKPQIRQYYNLFNYFYRVILIWMQIVFIGATLSSTTEQIQSIDHIDYLTALAIITWVVEQSNLLAIYSCGKKITFRRFCYVLCGFVLLYQNLIMPDYNHILFLFINYICDLIKNIISLFYYDHRLPRVINTMIKPLYFIISISLTIPHIQYLPNFLTLLVITSTSFYDAYTTIN